MNRSFQETISHWAERFEALSLRERLLCLAAVVALLYTFWDTLLMERVRTRQDAAVAQMKKWQSQVADIDQRIQLISANFSGSQQQLALRKLENLRTEINAVTQRQKALAVGFIRPTQMVDVLKGLLATEKGLELARLQSLAVQPLIQRVPPAVTEKNGRIPGNSPAPKTRPAQPEQTPELSSESALPQVYKHGLEIVFQGDYHSTLSYLSKLEQLPWKFYWEEVAYEVLDYPKAQIMVRIHTLSLDKGWISV